MCQKRPLIEQNAYSSNIQEPPFIEIVALALGMFINLKCKQEFAICIHYLFNGANDSRPVFKIKFYYFIYQVM